MIIDIKNIILVKACIFKKEISVNVY
jgi:hypothetical protein